MALQEYISIKCCSLRSKNNKETSFLAKYCALATL